MSVGQPTPATNGGGFYQTGQGAWPVAVTADRPPPHNIEAEQALLGAMLISPEACDRASSLVEEGDFFEPVHQDIFRWLLEMRSRSLRTSAQLLVAHLGERGRADVAGLTLAQYVARLAAEATTIVNAPDYAKTVRDFANRRRFIVVTAEANELAYSAPVDARSEQIVDATIDQLSEITSGHASQSLRATTIFFNDLAENPPPKPWLIKGAIARDETSSWIAPPGKGKSALLTDIAVHQAAGRDWRGFRTKGRCGVVYFALERADLVRRRLVAHKLRDGLRDLPIAVVGEVIDLLNRNCVDIILATIRKAEQGFGCEVGLAIFDTYSKGIAAGGGDEDKAKDQNVVQANLRRVFDRGRHIHIAGIGHTGKDESKGERGSNARLADVDLQVQITGNVIKTATVKKANDQAEGILTAFMLEPFDFGPDDDGDPFRTFIVSSELFAGESAQPSRKPTDRQVLALRALAEVVLSQGREPPAEYRLPLGINVVSAETWRDELLRCNVLDLKASNPWARFRELRDGLATRNLIGVRDEWVWPVRSL
jgi:DnaB-like helicase N terminal domain/AAA domain